jgi:hypothetical protein
MNGRMRREWGNRKFTERLASRCGEYVTPALKEFLDQFTRNERSSQARIISSYG